LAGCENFINLEPVERSENRCNMRIFGSLNYSMCKRVLNLLQAIYLGHRKTVVQRVTVVEFGVDDSGSDSTGYFRIKVRTDATELMDMIIAELKIKVMRSDQRS